MEASRELKGAKCVTLRAGLTREYVVSGEFWLPVSSWGRGVVQGSDVPDSLAIESVSVDPSLSKTTLARGNTNDWEGMVIYRGISICANCGSTF